MRSTINHTAPTTMQGMPADNTSEYVLAQVATWHADGALIHTQSAMEIASWFAIMGNSFHVFASTGVILYDFRDDLYYESSRVNESGYAAYTIDDANALLAVLAYVKRCSF
jgi:hypothetical protein